MTSSNQSDKHFFDTIRWPLIVVGLLLGHATIMLAAVTVALNDTSSGFDEVPYAVSVDDGATPPEAAR